MKTSEITAHGTINRRFFVKKKKGNELAYATRNSINKIRIAAFRVTIIAGTINKTLLYRQNILLYFDLDYLIAGTL